MRTCVPALPAYILQGPPTPEQVLQAYEATQEPTTTASAMYREAMRDYQILNTRFWDLIRASVDISGAYYEIDELEFDDFKVGELRDGVGLYYAAIAKASTDPIADEIEAVKTLANFPRISNAEADRVTLTQLDVHMNGLLKAWKAVTGNDPITKFDEFKARLLYSLPDEPVTSKVVVVRQHLIDAIERGEHKSTSVAGIISMASDRAKKLAMPIGKLTNGTNDTVTVAMTTGAGAGGTTGGPPTPGNKVRPRMGENDCDHCDLDFCLSKQWSKEQRKSAKSLCCVYSQKQASDIKQDPPLTKAETNALRTCQEAVKRDSKTKVKGASIRTLRPPSDV